MEPEGFITAFTTARHLPLSWARSIQSMPPHLLRSILILSHTESWVLSPKPLTPWLWRQVIWFSSSISLTPQVKSVISGQWSVSKCSHYKQRGLHIILHIDWKFVSVYGYLTHSACAEKHILGACLLSVLSTVPLAVLSDAVVRVLAVCVCALPSAHFYDGTEANVITVPTECPAAVAYSGFFFWHSERAITMIIPDRNYELPKHHTYVSNFLLFVSVI